MPTTIAQLLRERKFHDCVSEGCFKEGSMQAAVDRVMRTYGLMVSLTDDEERAARERVVSFLAEKPEIDEKALAIEGLRYLRSVRQIEIKD
jgi:hypothetical protein